ncbi:hypothetical protein Tco_0652187 [Tanacetum coccineum]|uniref:Uncharacterized protein n=1 Tax=Tanacetum coccineum TaxID=301880 RepID=A0ABQ4WWV5_9ASTR
MEQMTSICDMAGQIMQKKEEEKRIAEEQAAKDRYWKIPICYDDDEDYTIAITPVLSTEEPVELPNRMSILTLFRVCDVPLCNNPTPLEAFKEHSEIVVDFNDDSTLSDDDSFSIGGIDIDILLTIKDDILREKLLNVNLLIANIEALKDNPTPSFGFNVSDSTTTRSDYSLPGYEAFYFDDDHIEEKSSGSTTTHSDISLSKYDSFIFDLSINPFPPADRSDFYHEEFADELAHIISPPEYDCFYFKSEPDPGELTSIVDSGIRENVLSTTNVNLPFEDDQSPLLAYVMYLFFLFLTYLVYCPPYLPLLRNKDTCF